MFSVSRLSEFLMILHSFAIAVAVKTLSPVTILTVIPAALHAATASGTSVLKISLIPTIAIKVSPEDSTIPTPSALGSRSS